MNVYPLIFMPIPKRRIWGGRRLAELFDKPLPTGVPIGETWEVCDLEEEQSVVANGPEQGKTLHEVMEAWGGALLGRATPIDGRFPLLIKFLDARETLSVQVHPATAMAARLGGSVRVKHEAWYVIDAEPGACIYRGLRKGVDKAQFEQAARSGDVEPLLHRVPVRRGSCHYLPSGTLHALGGGVVVAEVQTPSDVTYRVHDWNRIDPATRQPRELHVERALESIAFDDAADPPPPRSHVVSLWTAVTRLVECESFIIEKVRMVEGLQQEIPYAELVVWIVLAGDGKITAKAAPDAPFRKGDVVVLPADLRDGRVHTNADCVWLEVTIPQPSDLAAFDRPDASTLRAPDGAPASPININLPKH